MSSEEHPIAFKQNIQLLREAYEARRVASNLYPPAGKIIEESVVEHSASHDIHLIWYEDEGSDHRHVRLHDIPNTLSGNVLRLRHDLPQEPFHIEIEGDSVKAIDNPPLLPEESSIRDDEDCSASLGLLSVVDVDPAIHFTKKAKYNSEILNYLKIQANRSSKNLLSSNHVITLLGRNTNNEMVFPKATTSLRPFYTIHDLPTYKQWIIEMIAALRFIHAHGVVHKDLKPANLLFVPDQSRLRLVLCDLESRWGNRDAPELDKTAGSDAGWSEKSDIYDISLCIKGMVYGNNPINSVVAAEWEVPTPLDEICRACTTADPMMRPSLDQVEVLVRAIPTTE